MWKIQFYSVNIGNFGIFFCGKPGGKRVENLWKIRTHYERLSERFQIVENGENFQQGVENWEKLSVFSDFLAYGKPNRAKEKDPRGGLFSLILCERTHGFYANERTGFMRTDAGFMRTNAGFMRMFARVYANERRVYADVRRGFTRTNAGFMRTNAGFVSVSVLFPFRFFSFRLFGYALAGTVPSLHTTAAFATASLPEENAK